MTPSLSPLYILEHIIIMILKDITRIKKLTPLFNKYLKYPFSDIQLMPSCHVVSKSILRTRAIVLICKSASNSKTRSSFVLKPSEATAPTPCAFDFDEK